MSSFNNKDNLRIKIRAMRAEMSLKEQRNKSVAICNNFIGNIPLNQRDKIALYWPIPYEVDVRLLIDALVEMGHICALPCVTGKNKALIFRHYEKNMELVPHNINGVILSQPPESAIVVNPNIIVTPLLAFDILGNRLGYGGGFYDRTIEKLSSKSDLMIVGLSYGFGQVTQIPTDKHDQKIDCCVTENGVIICG